MKILIPKRDTVPGPQPSSVHPLFFLAGPIWGGADWQDEMCRILDQLSQHCVIACPCNWEENHPLGASFVGEDDHLRYPKQTHWERCYLELAGLTHPQGCVVFWLPFESKEFPHPGPGPYARDTREEIGRWEVRMELQGARVVFGGDPNFYGLDVIRTNLDDAMGHRVPVYASMRETAEAALKTSVRTIRR